MKVDRLLLKMPVRLGPMVKGLPICRRKIAGQQSCNYVLPRVRTTAVSTQPLQAFGFSRLRAPEKLVICRTQPHT